MDISQNIAMNLPILYTLAMNDLWPNKTLCEALFGRDFCGLPLVQFEVITPGHTAPTLLPGFRTHGPKCYQPADKS